MQVDGHRFVSSKIAIRLGVIGGGSFGGTSDDDDDEDDESDDDDSDDDTTTNLEAAAVEALVGAVYYLTPESMWSFYGGAEYRARVTERSSGDPGAVSAVLGLQGALSSRASFFIEGGYGIRLRRGDEGELQTRIVGLAGLRIRF